MMLNFNNKTVQSVNNRGWIELPGGLGDKKSQVENEKREGNATQCLLFLSETEQSDKILINNYTK
jgi:hypothetical protein